ncbi:hypothetical protein [Desulfolutivibrio sp.]|uniref:hypothetical protein n=1 Tax=Desulfolutivibrio sp. TaxID=2773296 RepID=UPI002F968F00
MRKHWLILGCLVGLLGLASVTDSYAGRKKPPQPTEEMSAADKIKANPTVIEDGAKFQPPDLREIAVTTGAIIRFYGFTCNSINTLIRPQNGGLQVWCDGMAHVYRIRDYGGKVLVTPVLMP